MSDCHNNPTKPVKMSGYMEKKGKLRMVSTWKKHWFVLEDRLLLYYRSKDEYDAISPCKGTINLGPPCTVKSCPSMVCVFQIQTRSSVITLRTENEVEQKKWMHAIMLALNQDYKVDFAKLAHFKRYSLENLFPKEEPCDNNVKKLTDQKVTAGGDHLYRDLNDRLLKLGTRPLGGSLGSIPGKNEDVELRPNNFHQQNHSNLYERISASSQISSFFVENQDYGTPRHSVVIENDQYCTGNDLITHQLDHEVIYDEPQIKPDEHEYETVQYCLPKVGETKKVTKSQSFLKKVFKKKTKRSSKTNDDAKNVIVDDAKIYEEVNQDVHKLETSDQNAIQMLSEFKTILEQEKQKVKKLSNQSSIEEDPQRNNFDDNFAPNLPPKKAKINQNESVRSIDEILRDLDREKPENKVKKLIEKFSESEDDEVVLRNKQQKPSQQRHSEELYRLLDELTKVTTAPILTPGVTNSLVNPNLSEDAWLRLLPTRERRLSEPDYDVPRSHKSILMQLKSERDVFFEPILPPPEEYQKQETVISPTFFQDSLCISMTPDSLEIDSSPKTITFNSHHYVDHDSHHQVDNEVIYALPKPYISTHIVNTCRNNICIPNSNEDQIIYKNVRNNNNVDEVFVDSLELCNESLTEF